MSLINMALALGMAAVSAKSTMLRNQSGAQAAPTPRLQDQVLSNDIVVVGNKADKYKHITEFAESITKDLDFNNPLARYTSPICIDIKGLRDQQDREIKTNILFNLKIIKVAYKLEGCHPNASVFFVDNPKDVMRSIYKSSPMLGDLDHHEKNKKLEGDDESITIQNIISRGVDGDKIVGKAVPSRSASIIDLPIRRDIESSIVLVNRNSIVEYSIRQISDFVTFRILANVQPPPSKTGKSILEMFNMRKSDCPKNLTSWDISYLKEIYSGNGNERGVRKIGQATRRMLREDR